MKTQHINETGKKQIEKFLRENHRNPENAIYCIAAWVEEAKNSLRECNWPAIVEIPSYSSASGRTVTLSIYEDGIDTVEHPDDDDTDAQ